MTSRLSDFRRWRVRRIRHGIALRTGPRRGIAFTWRPLRIWNDLRRAASGRGGAMTDQGQPDVADAIMDAALERAWRAEPEVERLRERIEELHIEGGIVKGNLVASERRVERLREALAFTRAERDELLAALEAVHPQCERAGCPACNALIRHAQTRF